MAKRRTTEDHLALLRNLRAADPGPATAAALRDLLADAKLHGIILKGAATLADEIAARELAADLARCTLALLRGDPKRDPGCEGKTAALSTLVAWDTNVPELYQQAATYRQFVPVFGGSKDVAAELRGLAALGIAGTRPPGAVDLLVDLLADPEKDTRARAAMALGRWRGPEALPLLRLKARLGDEDAEVLAEVFGSLLQQDSAQLDVVAGFLTDANLSIVEAAALALGQSKLEAALAALIDAWPKLRGSTVASTLILAVSLVRTDKAVDWLLERLADSRGKESLSILDALELFRSDAKVAARIRAITDKRPDLRNAENRR